MSQPGWILLAAFLAVFMQAGFAMITTGFCRAKNAAHTVAMNFMIYPIGILGYWVCGFALQTGSRRFFFGSDLGDAAVVTQFLFQMAAMGVAATIPTGALAERWKWSAFLVYGFFTSMLAYPLFASWVWSGGWLSQLGVRLGLGHGHVDFAGSSVVHMAGGVAGLAGAMVLGPRLGKFTRAGKPVAMPGHHIPMAVVGTFVLAFGWFGLNTGRTLSGGELRLAAVAADTVLASAAGAVAAMVVMTVRFGKPDPSMMANGMLAGLVAIAAPCAFVSGPFAVLIGAVAGVIVVFSVFFVEGRLRLDDPVGAISVHGVSGLWGVVSLGLFADGSYGDGWNGVPGTVRGLLYGDPGQLVAQCAGALACALFVFASSWAFFKVVDALVGNRVPAEAELAGLDLPQMGALGYPEFNLSSGALAGWTAEPAPTFVSKE
ncbi:MAG TPA: ammonium transporter [Vicinamibacteria bacterium]|nr:ammonium transporter [Vicinamibacteria bacterium]